MPIRRGGLVTILKRLRHGNGQAGDGDHCHHQPQGDIAYRFFEIGLRCEQRENVMRHRFSMRFSHATVNSSAFRDALKPLSP